MASLDKISVKAEINRLKADFARFGGEGKSSLKVKHREWSFIIIELILAQDLSLVKSMIGIVAAKASLLKFALCLHQALEEWERQATEELLNMPALSREEQAPLLPLSAAKKPSSKVIEFSVVARKRLRENMKEIPPPGNRASILRPIAGDQTRGTLILLY